MSARPIPTFAAHVRVVAAFHKSAAERALEEKLDRSAKHRPGRPGRRYDPFGLEIGGVAWRVFAVMINHKPPPNTPDSTARLLAAELDVNYDAASSALQRLRSKGLLRRAGIGVYVMPEHVKRQARAGARIDHE